MADNHKMILESLNEKLEKAKVGNHKTYIECTKMYEQFSANLREKYLSDFPSEYEIVSDYNAVKFKVQYPGYDYKREAMELYFHDKYSRDYKEELEPTLSLDYNSQRCDEGNEFELKRLQTLGILVKVFENEEFRKYVKSEVLKVKTYRHDNVVYESDIERAISDVKSKMKEENFEARIKEGVIWEGEHLYINVTSRTCISGEKFEIIKFTNKTVTLKTSRKGSQYENETKIKRDQMHRLFDRMDEKKAEINRNEELKKMSDEELTKFDDYVNTHPYRERRMAKNILEERKSEVAKAQEASNE